MPLRSRIRPFFFPVLLVLAGAAAAVLAVLLYRGVAVPPALLNSGVAAWTADRYGVRLRIDGVRLSAFRGCGFDVDAGGLDLSLVDPGLRVRSGRLQWCASRPLQSAGIVVDTAFRDGLLRVDGLEAGPESGAAAVRGVALSLDDDTAVDVASAGAAPGSPVSARGVVVRAGGASVRVDAVDAGAAGAAGAAGGSAGRVVSLAGGQLDAGTVSASAIRVALPPPEGARSLPGFSQFGELRDAFLGFLDRTGKRLRGDARILAAVLSVVFFLLKFWTTAWISRSSVRVLLGLACALAPLGVYAAWNDALPFRRLLLVELAACSAMASILLAAVYRSAPRRYQRWEPFSIDVLCAAIVLPLAAYRIDFNPVVPELTSASLRQLNLTDIGVEGSRASCGVAEPVVFRAGALLVRGVEARFGAAPEARPGLRIESIAAVALGVSVGGAGVEPAALRVSGLDARIAGVEADLGWSPPVLRGLTARARAAGSLETPRTTRELRDVEIFGIASEPRPLSFNADVTVIASGTRPAIGRELKNFAGAEGAAGGVVNVRALVSAAGDPFAVRFAAAAKVLAGPAELVVTADGDPERIEIRSVESLPGSGIGIAKGSGRIARTGGTEGALRLQDLRYAAGGAAAHLDRADIAVSSAPACGPLHQAFSAAIAGAAIERPDGSRAEAGGVDVRVRREQSGPGEAAASVQASVRESKFAAPASSGTAPGAIAGDLPSFQIALNGVASTELVPRTFSGDMRFSLSADEVLLRNREPLTFSADLWKGAVRVPMQRQTLQQRFAEQAPFEIPVDLSASVERAGAPVAQARLLVGALPVSAGLIRADLRDLRIEAGSDTGLAFSSGWSTVDLPPAPLQTICLESVPAFELVAAGRVGRLDFPAMRGESAAPASWQPCFGFSNSAGGRSFRFDGAGSSLRVDLGNGRGFSIREVGNRLERVDLGGGRVRSLSLHTELAGIQTPAGAGDLGLKTHFSVSPSSGVEVAAAMSASGGMELLGLRVGVRPEGIRADVSQSGRTEDLVAAVRPFLPIGLFDRFTPRARLDSLSIDAGLGPGGLRSIDVQAALAPGPLADIVLPFGGASRQTRWTGENPAASPLRFRFTAPIPAADGAPQPVELRADVSGLRVDSSDAQGNPDSAGVDLHVEARGTLQSGPAAPRPVLDRAAETAADLVSQARKLSGLLAEPQAAPPSGLDDLRWNLRFSNPGTDAPLLRLADGSAELDVRAVSSVSWSSGAEGIRSEIGFAGATGAGLSLHDGLLVLDARAPLDVSAAAGGGPLRRWSFDLPLLAAFDRRLSPSPDAAEGLWDQARYAGFWSGYPVRRAAGGRHALVDDARLLVGPLSLRQLLVPLEPLKIAVGHSGGLQIHVPFKGRTLFGTVDALAEAGLRWNNDQASIDTRVRLASRNLQAGALGLAEDGGHLPFLQDELDADLRVSAEDFPLTRETPAGLASLDRSLLEHVTLDLSLRRSSRNAATPGVLQFSSGARVRTLNQVLDRIIHDVQLAVPPRAVFYRDLEVRLEMERGRIRTESPWLKMGGFEIFSSPGLALEGNIRLFGARNGETLHARDLLGTFVRE